MLGKQSSYSKNSHTKAQEIISAPSFAIISVHLALRIDRSIVVSMNIEPLLSSYLNESPLLSRICPDLLRTTSMLRIQPGISK